MGVCGGERWKAKLFTDFTLIRYIFPWILLLLSIDFFFSTLKTFTGFTSNIFMVAPLLTPSRLIWWCILYNVITEGKTRLIRYSVWSSIAALMCIFQFSVLPVKSNKTPLSSSSACTPCFTLLCYSRLTCTVPVLFLTGMSLWSFQSYEYLRHSYKLLCWLKILDHIIF